MDQPIDIARTYLARRYRELYGNDFRDFSVDIATNSDMPTWITLSKDLSPASDNNQNALVLDPEIGTALYLLRYDKEVDIRAQMARAVGLRSRLLRRQDHAKTRIDPNGAWRIVLHWMVEEEDSKQWIADTASIRRESAHLEEIPIDAVLRKNTSWLDAFEEHCLPRLLLTLRYVLRQRTPHDVINWSSADERVREQLENFADKFSTSLEIKYANQVLDLIRNNSKSMESESYPYPGNPTKFSRLSVRDFRNLQKVDLVAGSESEIVKTSVVHGPNGSGKTSLYEALEFGLSGVSRRYLSFQADQDITSKRSYMNYMEQYLHPIGKADSTPAVLLDEIKTFPQDEIIVDMQAALDSLKGSLLSQEKSREFLGMSAANLSAEVLGDFSQLATRLQLFSDESWEKARVAQQNLLRRLSLSGNITKAETACAKIVKQTIESVAVASPTIARWLEDSRLSFAPLTSVATDRLKQLRLIYQEIDITVSKASKSRGAESISTEIKPLLNSAWEWQSATAAWLTEVIDWRTSWPEGLIEQLQIWGEWLEQRSKLPVDSNQEGQVLPSVIRREDLERELSEITAEGQVLSARENHFKSLDDFLQRTWSPVHPNECPTCNTDLSKRGGVLETVATLINENSRKRDSLRRRYAEIQLDLKEITRVLGQKQRAHPPLSDQQRSLLVETLSGKLPNSISIESMLSNSADIGLLTGWLAAVGQCPSPHDEVNPERRDQELNTIAASLARDFNDVDITFEAPSAWKSVRNVLNKSLAGVLERHLPSTIVGIWHELVLNLTPAPWQIPGRLGIKVESRRNNNEATVRLETEAGTRYARYIINEAEVHTFGLAWFIVRYVTSGRFRHALLALDDPAQEMDQTTYRDLCRFLETLLRLHRIHKIPLTLLVFLHQDERALDLARATDGLFHRLFWNRGHPDLEKGIYLHNFDHHAPAPYEILAPSESVIT